MWKRDQAQKPTTAEPATSATPTVPQVLTPPVSQATAPIPSQPIQPIGRNETSMVNIGKSVTIKGDLQGSEDLTIEGQIEGRIELKENMLTIGPNARIKAQVFAKTVVILGTVTGNVTASEKVDIRDGATMDGDVAAPKVAIAEGAQFHGTVDMSSGTKRAEPPKQPNAVSIATAKPAPVTPSAAAATH